MSNIDWTNPSCKISDHFTVKEALWLPQWKRLANESDGLNDDIKANLVTLFQKMDVVREYFGAPINAHCAYRPEEYNKLVKGAANSAHKFGMAFDFDISGVNCDDAREQINNEGKLDEWEMRMEDMKGGNWIHLDYRELAPGGHRFFKP